MTSGRRLMTGRPTGRPRRRVYPPAAWETVLARLKEGRTLTKACEGDDLPTPTAVIERTKSDDAFAEMYARAREIGYTLLADELLDIADDNSLDVTLERDEAGNVTGIKVNGEAIQRAKLRVDTRKWMLAKMLPKIYGERPAEDPAAVDLRDMIRREAEAMGQLFAQRPNGAAGKE